LLVVLGWVQMWWVGSGWISQLMGWVGSGHTKLTHGQLWAALQVPPGTNCRGTHLALFRFFSNFYNAIVVTYT